MLQSVLESSWFVLRFQVASAGVGAPAAVSMVFATSAKTGATVALSSGALSTAGAAIVTGIETKNVEETLKEAALVGSESFKWGAIAGVVTGGISETVSWLDLQEVIQHRENLS